MKKEKISQLKIEESNGKTIVVEDKKSRKELKAIKKQQKRNQKAKNKQIKVLEKSKRKEEKKKEKEHNKQLKEKYNLNYFKKLAIVQKEIKKQRVESKQEALEYEKTMNAIYKKRKMAQWLKLDNAGTIYPPAQKKNWNFVYRITAVTKTKVDVNLFSQAVEEVLPRFPSFNVCLKKGIFWNYFERAPRKPKPIRDLDFPCAPFDLSDTMFPLFRVLFDDYKICLECFHGVSDGRGALLFLNSILAHYIELSGTVIADKSTVLDAKDMPTKEELEDSFSAYYTKQKLPKPKERAAYKIKGEKLDDGVVNTIIAEMPVDQIKEVAKKYDCSLTVLLTAAIGYVTYFKKEKNNHKPIRISVPIDLRTRFPSKTLRNFSSYINVDVDGQNLSFEDVINIFKEHFAKINQDYLQSNINSNVKLQKNFFIKIIPWFIKSIILKTAFNIVGENYQTLAFSNLGAVSVPKEFENYIDRYEVNLGKSGYNTKSIGVVSFGNKLVLSFSSNIVENDTEKDYFLFLRKLGIDVKLGTNRRDIYGTI